MGLFRSVMLSLIAISFFAVACNKNGDSFSPVGQGRGSGSGKSGSGKTDGTGDGNATTADDLGKLSEPEKAYVLQTAKDVTQVRNMAREMDRLFNQIWEGYWSSKKIDVSKKTNVFRTLEIALKSNFADNGISLSALLLPTVTAATGTTAAATPGFAAPQQAPKMLIGPVRKSGMPSVSPRDRNGNSAKTATTTTCQFDSVYTFEIIEKKTVEMKVQDQLQKVEMPQAYRIGHYACANGNTEREVLATIYMMADDKGPYTSIRFDKKGMAKELGFGITILNQLAGNGTMKETDPYCTFRSDSTDQMTSISCNEIGQAVDAAASSFLVFRPLNFVRAAEKPLSGKVMEYVIGGSKGTMEPTKTTESEMNDDLTHGRFEFNEVPLKAVEQIPTKEVVGTPESVAPAATTEKPTETPAAPSAAENSETSADSQNQTAPPANHTEVSPDAVAAPPLEGQQVDEDGNLIPLDTEVTEGAVPVSQPAAPQLAPQT